MAKPSSTERPSTAAGERIRAALHAQGLRVADLAQRLGYVQADGTPTKYTYDLLSGRQRLSGRQLERIGDELGLDLDDLCFDAGMVPADITQRLTRDRAFLAAVRALMGNG